MCDPPKESGEPKTARHVPVLLREVIEFLDLRMGQMVVDGTVGAAGHSAQIVQRIGRNGTLVGLDRDPMMLQFASSVLAASHAHLCQASYAELPAVLDRINKTEGSSIESVDRILLDLGLSSDQLADVARGFSFEADGPLDLRFDPSVGEPAWRLIDRVNEDNLEQILREYGEERFSRVIAKHLVANRRRCPVRTASELSAAVARAIPRRAQRQARKQPATRVFQALRIAVNEELSHLKTALQHGLYDALAPGGRLVIISFHSLEDRMVKNAFREQERWQNLTPKPIVPTPIEKRMNPRCRSAKLRAATKR